MVIRVKEKQRFNSSRAEAITKAPAHISPNKKNFLADENFFSPNGINFSPEEKKIKFADFAAMLPQISRNASV